MALLSCPFCRALYTKGEEKTCPECGVALVPLERLPPSVEARAEEPPKYVLPEDEPLPFSYWGRGRGALALLCIAGLVAFFLPWVELTFPDPEVRSGFDLARGRAGWLWGGAAAWFVLLPLVLTRRTISAMRGVRPIAALFASMTLGEVLMMVLLPPASSPALRYSYEWSWGLFTSGAISLAATVIALRFGGSLPPLPDISVPVEQSSDGRTLH